MKDTFCLYCKKKMGTHPDEYRGYGICAECNQAYSEGPYLKQQLASRTILLQEAIELMMNIPVPLTLFSIDKIREFLRKSEIIELMEVK